MINTNTGLQPVNVVEDTPKGREFHDKIQTNGNVRPTNVRNTGRGRNTNGRGIVPTSGRNTGRGGNSNGRGMTGRGGINRYVANTAHDGNGERTTQIVRANEPDTGIEDNEKHDTNEEDILVGKHNETNLEDIPENGEEDFNMIVDPETGGIEENTLKEGWTKVGAKTADKEGRETGRDRQKQQISEMKYCHETEENEETEREEERTWVFDNIEETTEENLKEMIETCGGEVLTTKKMEKGGIAVTMRERDAVAAMSDIKDYCAKKKYRIHIPKNQLQGSANIFVRNLNTNSTAKDIVGMIEEEGVKVLDLYLIRNKMTSRFTGLAKAVLLGNSIMNKWINEGRGNLGGVRRPMERERKAKKCNNCLRYNHKSEDCPTGKQCRKCGSSKHIAKDCDTPKEEVAKQCLYCRKEGHVSRECEIRREEEKEERKQHRKDQTIKIRTVWQRRPEKRETKKNQDMDNSFESNITATTNVSSLTRTVNADVVEMMKQEMMDTQGRINEGLKETQTKWQREIQETLENIKNKEELNTAKEDKETIKDIVKHMKEEFKQQQKENVQSMTIEFDRQKREINKEWEKRMDLQKRSDKVWDKRIKEQHESTMIIVKKMIEQFTEVMNKRPTNRTKRKIEEEDENMEEQGEIEEMNIEEERTKLRRRVTVTQEALEALEIKQKKEKKQEGMVTRKLRIPTYKNLK